MNQIKSKASSQLQISSRNKYIAKRSRAASTEINHLNYNKNYLILNYYITLLS